MSYSQFTLEQIKSDFGITLSEKVGFFAQVSERKYSQLLDETLEYNIPLALSINSEKSRSEMIVTPILIEVRKQLNNQISLFSGKDFNVDAQKGLTGFCDFLISKSNEQLIIESPIITLVEAKNDNIESGLAQCMAEMIAAQLFNQRQNQEIKRIYGVITTGSIWKFMQLEATTITIDLNEYFLVNVDKIIGILIHFIESTNN
ncbi:hypothetical protein [Cuspidothrix issatschenkoi]|uniref:Uncharacterized protein n=1 Tax=Cuspidothrix issatschenkoi CHARLIE-1 TaxID=2052836 RepID=A0A2S6CQU5_9CYAN|nr:hypothetical protein [Cuspidothrix issatschenkoi]PPJ62089.1 hypothetical protein CUN59_17505 [Cuspidothrix issatschenkoi CHARLIE-1]